MTSLKEGAPGRPPVRSVAVDGPVRTVYELSADEASLLTELASTVAANPQTEPDGFCHEVSRLARRLPQGVAEAFANFAEVGSDSGLFVVRGLNVGQVPPTPLDNQGGIGGLTPMAVQVAILAHALGDMVVYEAEGTGFLMQDMVPNPAFVGRQSSQGSLQVLEAHTEQSFSPMRPDYVVLGCLRGDPHAATYVFSARTLAEHLSADDHAYARRPLWTTLIDDSFHPFVPDPDEIRGPFALLSGSSDDPTLLIDQELTHGMTARADNLLQSIIDIYVAHRVEFILSQGDVAFVDNTRAMHGRSAFKPRFDGTDRFIVRGFVVRDLRRTSPARSLGSRRIQAAFS